MALAGLPPSAQVLVVWNHLPPFLCLTLQKVLVEQLGVQLEQVPGAAAEVEGKVASELEDGEIPRQDE